MPTAFQEAVYSLTRKIPKGKVSTYADIAHALNTKAYRAVGQALTRNPDIPATPCHRVVASDGSLGGYASGAAKKQALLEAEGIVVNGGVIQHFERVHYVKLR